MTLKKAIGRLEITKKGNYSRDGVHILIEDLLKLSIKEKKIRKGSGKI